MTKVQLETEMYVAFPYLITEFIDLDELEANTFVSPCGA